jgi:hypothetical protein
MHMSNGLLKAGRKESRVSLQKADSHFCGVELVAGGRVKDLRHAYFKTKARNK